MPRATLGRYRPLRMKGKALNGRTSLAALSLAAAIAAPLAARAQTSGVTYYSPPSIMKRGTNSSPIAGAGTVVVQVMVNKDGTFKVTRVIHSTNTGDNAAALEIAKSSTYKPAARGAEKQTAFYDFTLKFTSTGAAAATSQSGPAAGAAQYERMIRAGNYSGAQSGLKTYLAQHPEDENAEQLLGVASSFLNNDEDAAAAFDKGGTISSNYKSVAAKAYADYAVTAQKNNEPDKAVAAAKKAVALEPGFYYYNTLGSAEASAGQNDAAIADLEKARSLGTSEKASDRALVDANLASAYLSAGKPDMAKQVAAEGTQLDPSSTGVQNVLANYYIKQAQTAQAAGKNAAAATAFEQAAAAAPSQAATLYTQAAFANLGANPDATSAKADADKALALKPDDPSANYAAGIALADQPGKSKDALVYLNKADGLAKTANDTKLTSQIEAAIKQLSGTPK
jgi:Flp pilus assembly protein TadD